MLILSINYFLAFLDKKAWTIVHDLDRF